MHKFLKIENTWDHDKVLCYLIKLRSSVKTAPLHCTLVINTNASILCAFQPFSKRTCVIEGPAFPKTGCTRYCKITIKVHSYNSLRWNFSKGFSKFFKGLSLALWPILQDWDTHADRCPCTFHINPSTGGWEQNTRKIFASIHSPTCNNSSVQHTHTLVLQTRLFSCHMLLTTTILH